MARISEIQVRLWSGGLGNWRWQHSVATQTGTWEPPVNAYRCAKCICICVDLAGVEKADIEVQVEPEQISISGVRKPPEPLDAPRKPLQVMAMEIDYGPFARTIPLPVRIDVEQVTAQQEQGLLWIELPIWGAEA